MSAFRPIEEFCRNAAIGVRGSFTEDHEYYRHFAAADFARSHLWSSVFSANCYFSYFSIFQDLAEEINFGDVCTAAIDGAHLNADVVPIELFNAREVFMSSEILNLTKVDKSAVEACFDKHFPRLKEARDSVAHSHDRVFARFRDKQLHAEIGSRAIAPAGKNFVSVRGQDFLFDFQISHFAELFAELRTIMVPQCA
jgi:hypothetical protein